MTAAEVLSWIPLLLLIAVIFGCAWWSMRDVSKIGNQIDHRDDLQ